MRTKLTTALSLLVIVLITTFGIQPAHASYPDDAFGGPFPGHTVPPGGYSLVNGSYRAVFQTDGNFVVYYTNATPARALWSSGTANKGAVKLSLQTDCNMVIYGANNKVLWTSHTARQCGVAYATLQMQTDGNLVEYVYNSAYRLVPVWASNSVFH